MTTTTMLPREHFLMHVGDAIHFQASSKQLIWGITSGQSCAKSFIKKVKDGDILWFVKSKSKGQIFAVATYTGTKERILGPLIELSLTNTELGWTKTQGEWNTEVHYKDLYMLERCKLYSEIKGAVGIRPYNMNCKIDLPTEYINIQRYLQIENPV